MSSHDATHHHPAEEPRSKTSFTASFWLVVILVGLFIASLNFINAMHHEDHSNVTIIKDPISHKPAMEEAQATAPVSEAHEGHESHEATVPATDTLPAAEAAHHSEEAHH